jgi:CRP/FNR family cyclic AMP-dependent transcriptional regulator
MREHPFVNLPGTLHGVPFLSGLDERSLDLVLLGTTLFEYEPGESVVDEGHDASAFYVLLRGTVDVTKDGVKVGEIAGRGETIGELTLLEGAQRGATVTANDKVFCLRVGREALDDLNGEQKFVYQAALYRCLTEILVERLQSTNERLARTEAALKTVHDA